MIRALNPTPLEIVDQHSDGPALRDALANQIYEQQIDRHGLPALSSVQTFCGDLASLLAAGSWKSMANPAGRKLSASLGVGSEPAHCTEAFCELFPPVDEPVIVPVQRPLLTPVSPAQLRAPTPSTSPVFASSPAQDDDSIGGSSVSSCDSSSSSSFDVNRLTLGPSDENNADDDDDGSDSDDETFETASHSSDSSDVSSDCDDEDDDDEPDAPDHALAKLCLPDVFVNYWHCVVCNDKSPTEPGLLQAYGSVFGDESLGVQSGRRLAKFLRARDSRGEVLRALDLLLKEPNARLLPGWRKPGAQKCLTIDVAPQAPVHFLVTQRIADYIERLCLLINTGACVRSLSKSSPESTLLQMANQWMESYRLIAELQRILSGL